MSDWEIAFNTRAGVTSAYQKVSPVMRIAVKNDGVIEEVMCECGV